MVFHPAGNAGLATVLAAPRYTFMHQVHTTYEDGVHAVLFSSVPDLDVKPEWVERARARTQSVSRGWLDCGWCCIHNYLHFVTVAMQLKQVMPADVKLPMPAHTVWDWDWGVVSVAVLGRLVVA